MRSLRGPCKRDEEEDLRGPCKRDEEEDEEEEEVRGGSRGKDRRKTTRAEEVPDTVLVLVLQERV